ncbi:hypothetical protein EGH21_04480 [Halomicroarcula sp. F13]|uniref:DUF7847 domain-containing protein n=1 Tax=Haloarcula rubra TaxID=2487747 RepID=A0AAW4PPD1_9EURY|nr:hypothetical protein [Halomicroarcula rubra]MBX0322288.1 hypothetical protein [Halomicroarcula rubra]
MALQIGSTLREAGSQLVGRTGAILLVTYLVLLMGFQAAFNTLFAVLYARWGFEDVAATLPLTLDVPLSVAGVGVLLGMVLALYHSVVATRTFVAGARDSFPAGALTRNVPLALLNLAVGGLVYGAVVFLGTLLFVLPGIVAYVALLFLLPYVAVEDRNFVDALRSSYRLSRGHWVRLFALVFLLVATSSLLGGVAGLVGSLLLPRGVAQLVIVLVQTPVSLFVAAAIAVAFRQLRDEAAGESPVSPRNAETPSTPD